MAIAKRWKHGAIPALMIHGSIGTVYCWSMLGGTLRERVGEGYEWAFSLAILFLGLSAAFLGPFVERDVRRAARFSALFFGAGMILSGVACMVGSKTLLFASYGVIMGIGLGLGYLSPVKTLILWFKDNKGLATGLAISGFGLAKVLATPSFSYMLDNYGIEAMFFAHGVIYTLIMLAGSALLKKPEGTEPKKGGSISLAEWRERMSEVLKLPKLGLYWVIFYLNISAGLAIISHEKVLFLDSGFINIIGLSLVMCAVFNTLGRLCVSWASDYLKDRWRAFVLILLISTAVCAVVLSNIPLAVMVAIFACNAGYGAMFSTMPSALSDRYGNEKLSEVHGVILSAWAFAGLTGNQLASLIVHLNDGDPEYIIPVAGVLYLIAFVIAISNSRRH